MRLRWLCAAPVFAVVLSLAPACEETPVTGIGLSMSAPQGVLDEATAIKLSVFDSTGHTCNADGTVDEIPAEAQKFDLKSSGCDSGVKWCGEITLDRDDSTQLFYVEATNSTGLLGQGCATKKIDQDPIEVSVKIVRHVEPACCGNGTIEAGELCDNGGDDTCGGTTADAVCQADCSTKEVLVDDNGSGGVANGQGHLAMAFTPGEGQLSGGLRAVYNYSATQKDIGYRLLQADLSPVSEPATFAQAHRIFVRCTGMDALPVNDQYSPAIAPLGSGAVVAYISSEQQPLKFYAMVWATNKQGCSDTISGTLVSNGVDNVDDIDVATGPSDTALVVFQQNGKVLGRTFDGTSVGASILTLSDTGARPRVAGGTKGWVVTYEASGGGDSDGGVFYRRVSATGEASNPVLVNAKTSGKQDQPDVATTADGSLAVAFRSGGDVYLQRFSASDEPVGGDQDAALHADAAGEQAAPAIAAGTGGDFYAVAWESGSEIRARFAGIAGGFLFNNVSGQNDDFVVTPKGFTEPRGPAIAASDSVAFGWGDQKAAAPGLYVRRFPLPKQ